MSSPIRVDLAGRYALVTGASRGIGRAIAEELAGCGAVVVGTGRDARTLTASLREIQATSGTECHALEFDHARWAETAELTGRVLDVVPRVDILVNCAGGGHSGAIEQVDDADWQRSLDLNVSAAMTLCRELVPGMKVRRYGRIVNVASFVGVVGMARRTAYGTAKAALVGLTKMLAMELAPSGITVNAVAPGPVRTELMRRAWEDPLRRQEFTSLVPVGRWASTAEIAWPVLFLASDAASYVTGHVLEVDGGISAGRTMER